MPEFIDRPVPRQAYEALTAQHIHPVVARVLAARGMTSTRQLDNALNQMLPLTDMLHLDRMGQLLADAIGTGKRLLIVADYDSDGATACALGVLTLREIGAKVDFIVPNRFEYGYGLTPEIVQLAAARQPDILITVDNGIASVEGVEAAQALGIKVMITDHHLPGPRLPAAVCIVNPNQPGCGFASKHLAGVGVMFYVVTQLRAELRARGHFKSRPEPNLAAYLDLVALGTVADVVPLDHNNRVLVQQGLTRIRAGRARPGIQALLKAAGREASKLTVQDLGFVLGPRLNAAGRLSDMSLGIECLITPDHSRAAQLAVELDRLNRERREIESDMRDSALAHLERFDGAPGCGVCLYDDSWHQGVIGILAARLRERLFRPVIAFAQGAPGELKGSGRSVPALHLRDALDLVSKRHPDLILRFGGHAAAAGLSIASDRFEAFASAFDAVARERLTALDLLEQVPTDGALTEADFSFELVETLSDMIWGQGFPPPTFRDVFRIDQQRIVGAKHLRLRLRKVGGSRLLDGILFGQIGPLPVSVEAVYRLDINEYNGQRSVQAVVEHWQPHD
ncbi:MAG: single-stranded-DNA-specific exonuclease RecJ [Betaproteobacteria bacterium]|nr:single-stranded-DNA-specific exonuclease RecJ [Betaproteobacteria bacterium]